MHATLIRRQLGGLVPPKIATPKLVVRIKNFMENFKNFWPIFSILWYLRNRTKQSGGSGAGLGPLVNFYSKLPKGNSTARVSGIKGRYFSGDNASGKPIVALITSLFLIGYTIDYNSEFIMFLLLFWMLNELLCSALEYVVTLFESVYVFWR